MARNPIIREHSPEVPTPTDETPHACYDGWVFLGYKGVDEDGEDGEHVEVIERVPCRRCHPESL